MANKDDDILGNGGEDFSQDDFAIPDERDDSLDESDFADTFDFSDEDALMSEAEMVGGDDGFGDGFDDLEGGEKAHDEDAIGDDPSEYGHPGEDAEYAAESYEDQKPAGLGWKAWTGLGVAAIVVAGGLGVMVWPDAPAQRPVATAPPVQAPPMPASSAEGSAPVNVQAFPSAQTNDSSSTARISQMDTMQTGQPVIPDPSNRDPLPEEPRYLAALEEDRADFKAVSELANENMFRLEQMRQRFDRFSTETNGELSDLDRRVTALENGSSKPTSTMAGKTMASDSESRGNKSVATESDAGTQRQANFTSSSKSTYSIPKTPGEIKELQRTLRDFGYRPGKVDGILGNQTRWAIKRLQEEHGLPVNGWLSAETMMALENPKRYSGTYPKTNKQTASKPKAKTPVVAMASSTKKKLKWFVRGVTPSKAVVYRQDGLNYAVSVGSEIPGMGQVTGLDPAEHEVITVQGRIGKQ